MKDWTIHEIEGLTQAQIEAFADAHREEIKGHSAFFVELGRFGYSALVCADGRHLKHANEYQLHYPESRYPDRESLHRRFLEVLSGKLFTENELAETSKSYEEAQAKRSYLVNIYADRRQHQSIWCYGKPAEWYEREKDTAVFSRVAYGWYHAHDRDFVERMAALWDALEKANDPLRDYESAKEAFKYEMRNHEYAINWQGDWDVIRCFANVDGEDAEDMLPKTGWSPEAMRAYRDAAGEIMEEYRLVA